MPLDETQAKIYGNKLVPVRAKTPKYLSWAPNWTQRSPQKARVLFHSATRIPSSHQEILFRSNPQHTQGPQAVRLPILAEPNNYIVTWVLATPFSALCTLDALPFLVPTTQLLFYFWLRLNL
jgi:hypothetical protein